MPKKSIKRDILFLLLLAFIPFNTVQADVGPKPTMDFTFKQTFTGAPVTIVSGTLFECAQSDCLDAKPLVQEGPQHFSCDPSSCSALAYGFSSFNRLEIVFSDGKTRQSNIFKTTQFQASYHVSIRQDDLLVSPTFSLNLFTPLTYILLCGGCLIGIVLLIVVIVLLIRHSSRKK
jgi:hypothetical protein